MAKYSYFVVTFSILPVIVIAGVVALALMSNKEAEPTDAEGLQKDYALYAEVRQKLLDHYDGDLDESELRNEALRGLASGTGDRYTRVLPPIQAQEQKRDLGGAFFGIGAYIDPNEDGSIRISEPQPGGGAEEAGLLKDDVIVAVDGVSILDQTYDSTVARIKSDVEGSIVKLTVLRGGEPDNGTDPKAQRLDFSVKRGRVVIYSVHDVHLEERDGHRYGYLQVSDINANTYDEQFKPGVEELTSKGAEGLIIDLRGNGGGRVSVAVAMIDGLIKEPDALCVFTHSSRESNREMDAAYRTKDSESITDLPLVVLVDSGTASAAEIITGALKDHGRAYIIGERTYGKGIVQTIYKLKTDPNYTINITTTQYFTPLGRKVQDPAHSVFGGVTNDQLAIDLARWGHDHGNAQAYEFAQSILESDQSELGASSGAGGIQPDLVIHYREGEKARLHARLRIRQARHNRDEIAKASTYWDYEDRMLNAALDLLNGKPVTIKD
ncbi:MAG: PDZ domain-containing protein [Planctomycetes bacterium]|nr:PDZ domain-containing protein [Planctomycetota bacterium]